MCKKMRWGYFSVSYHTWCLGPDQTSERSNQSKHRSPPVTDQPGKGPIVSQPGGKVAGMAKQYESDVIDTQPSKGRPLPHNENNHVERTPVISSRHPSRQGSQESPMRRKDGSSHHTTPGSLSTHSRHSGSAHAAHSGGKIQMTETATSPDGPYHGDSFGSGGKIKKEFEVDYPIQKPAPKQKTKIVYDLGSPQMNTQGINASIPITTDKYTYTITSVLSSMSQHNDIHSPTSSPTSGTKRPISSYKIIQPNSNPKIGKQLRLSRICTVKDVKCCIFCYMNFSFEIFRIINT